MIPIVLAQLVVAQTTTDQEEVTNSSESIEDLDALLRDSRIDRYEEKSIQWRDPVAGMTQSQLIDGVQLLMYARHLKKLPAGYRNTVAFGKNAADFFANANFKNLRFGKKAADAAGEVLEHADEVDNALTQSADEVAEGLLRNGDEANRIQKIQNFLAAGGEVAEDSTEQLAKGASKSRIGRFAGPAFDIANGLLLIDRHFTKWAPWNEAERNLEVLKFYNTSQEFDTSKEDEFTDYLFSTGDFKKPDGTVVEDAQMVQAIIYKFAQDGTVTRFSGETIESNDSTTSKSHAYTSALTADNLEDANIDEEVMFLAKDFKNLAIQLREFNQKHLESEDVREELGILGKKLNAKINLARRLLSSGKTVISGTSRNHMLAGINVLEEYSLYISTLDTSALSTLKKETANAEITEAPKFGDQEKAVENIANTIKMKTFDSLEEKDKAELRKLVQSLEKKFNIVQNYLKQQKTSNPSSVSFSSDGVVTDANFNQVAHMLVGDFTNGSEYETSEVTLTDQEAEAFQDFIESGEDSSLNIPSILKHLKSIEPSTSSEAGDSISSANNIENIKKDLGNIRRTILKDENARATELAQLVVWLYENKDTKEALLSKISQGGSLEMGYMSNNIPSELETSRSNEAYQIKDLKATLESLVKLFKSNDKEATLKQIMQASN